MTMITTSVVGVLWRSSSRRRVDLGPAVFGSLPVAIVLYRCATERVDADPTADEVRIRNAFTNRRVAWSDIAGFQLADRRAMGVLHAQSVTC